MCDTLDRVRATGATAQPTTATVVDDSPLVVDWTPPQTGQQHRILEQICCVALCVVRAPALQPISGLYLCPQSTPTETLAQAQAGWNAGARPFAIPCDISVANITIGGGPQFAIILTSRAGFKQTMPAGWFLRAIISSQNGLNAPGPGAGSTATLNVLSTLEGPCTAK